MLEISSAIVEDRTTVAIEHVLNVSMMWTVLETDSVLQDLVSPDPGVNVPMILNVLETNSVLQESVITEDSMIEDI